MSLDSTPSEFRRSEEQLLSLVSSLDDFVFSIDLEGRLLFYQPMQWSIYDTPAVADAYLGAPYADVLPPEIAAVMPDGIEQVNRSLSPHPIQYTLHTERGLRHHKGRIAPMFSTRFALIGYTFVTSDVTESVLAKAREDRMMALEGLHREIESVFFESGDPDSAIALVLAKMGHMLDVSGAGVFHFRENERRLDCHQEWCAAGVKTCLGMINNLAFDEHMPSFEPMLAHEGVIAANDVGHLPPDMRDLFGSYAIQSLLMLPYRVNARMDGCIGVVDTRHPREWLPEEIGALRTAAEGYARLLERQRAERDLITARDTALRSAQHKSEFVAKMSHEIRTPMTALLGVIELMHETPLDEDQRELLSMAESNAKRLMNMLVEILDFSALEKGAVSLQSVPVDVRGILTEIETMWAEQARKKGLSFAVAFDDQVPARVLGDPGRLRQVLNHLTNNAVKFTDKGGIVLAVRELFSRNGRTRLRFEVQDTGVGIPPDKQQLIFDSFVQADNSISRRFEGAGLGLAICKQLVSLMDGSLDVQSVEGEGSIFSVTATFTVA